MAPQLQARTLLFSQIRWNEEDGTRAAEATQARLGTARFSG